MLADHVEITREDHPFRTPGGYRPGFRREFLDVVAAGRPVGRVARIGIFSEQTIYVWRRQDLIDSGQLVGTTSAENVELHAACRRIAELDAEVATWRDGLEDDSFPCQPSRRLLREPMRPGNRQ